MFILNSEQVYNKVVEEFSNMIFRIAYQNLCNTADAEDIVQEVFLSLIKSDTKAFADKEHLKAWLIRVAINKCIDCKKSFWQKNTVPLDEQIIVYTREEQDLTEEIFRLPRDYRNIIYLYYYEGYKIKEIAEILNIKQNTVNSKLQRGRKKLKVLIEEGDNGYGQKFIQKCTE